MTPRERVLAVLNGKKPDKTPFTLYEQKASQCSAETQLRNEGMCIVNRRVQPYRVETPNCKRVERRFRQGGRDYVETQIETPVGTVSRLEEQQDFTRWAVEKEFKTPADYETLKFIASDSAYIPDFESYSAAERELGEDVILRGGVGANPLHRIMIAWMGVETFAMEWMDNRNEILELNRVMCESIRQVFPLLAESPITHANFGGNEVPEVMGPERYEEYCLPLQQECAGIFHGKGKLLGSHMDGNNRAWSHILNRTGWDYVEALSPSPDTDMTLEDALAAWPEKVIWINFPSALHLRPIEEIKAYARHVAELSAETGRVILGITEDIPPSRMWNNLLAISDAIQEFPL